MNQDYSINNKPVAQNITQAITNAGVSPASKKKKKKKIGIENESNTICRESTDQDWPNENTKSKRKSAIILGDCMIQHKNGREKAKKLKPEYKDFVRTFPGAFTQGTADYIKLSILAKLDHLILHTGTNDWNWNAPPDEIAKIIIDLDSELKSERNWSLQKDQSKSSE